jgi:uncharacterized protein (TIGR02453 family)
MTDFVGFPPAAQRFFRSLDRNNNKAWFEANRAIYETAVREPLRALVEELDSAFGTIAPEIIGDPKRSLFRINRDIRFSRDKSPYKTNAGCWFYHQDAGRGVGQDADDGGAGFYFHIDGKTAFVAGGIWMPSRQSLGKLRDRLAGEWQTLSRIVEAPAFRRRFGRFESEAMLTRVPRGYAPDHPAAKWLRFQSFTASRSLPGTDLLSPKLVGKVARDFEALVPLVRWINGSLGFKPAKSRL